MLELYILIYLIHSFAVMLYNYEQGWNSDLIMIKFDFIPYLLHI